MANRWGNNGNSDRLYFLGSKISADGDCSLASKRHSLLGRKTMPKLESILKSRDITFPTKAHVVKAMVSPVIMYWCGSWTIKKKELTVLNCGVGQHSWESLGQQGDPINGHEFEWTPGVGDGQGSLACCSPWGHKELDMTEWLNWMLFPNIKILVKFWWNQDIATF